MAPILLARNQSIPPRRYRLSWERINLHRSCIYDAGTKILGTKYSGNSLFSRANFYAAHYPQFGRRIRCPFLVEDLNNTRQNLKTIPVLKHYMRHIFFLYKEFSISSKKRVSLIF